ncbi:lipopolysaccharide assembly protein LapB [Acidipila sp. EB88]|uniref:tetratricopeptide repeat protein n=1 Tax=Acidipila sp. EB88 TaxID=2305226 RepID=UPI000F5F4BC3|nr:tetratricopeptide repeat protein [Acidipila sp. EB88]RRA48596.1 tetratricopeptide repeat protein [Acidipila sp. EB88]
MPSLRAFDALRTTCLTLILCLPLALTAQAPKTVSDGKAQQAQRTPKPPALVDPTGPAVSLESSEALFDVAVALNACGYDAGLAQSDPIRQRVRDAVNQAARQSAEARDTRDKLCSFINGHRLYEGSRDLAQYVSLALYLTPPPELSPSVELADMPPDATQVVEMLPILRQFAEQVQLHLIWLRFHPEYEAEVTRLHDPLTHMILDANIYLKLPTSTYTGSRFLVVLEPMLDPGQTNARVYGTDYVVVASPVNGTINLHDVRHTYLHYDVEPLLYARASSMDRLLPLLKTVREAPLEYQYRADIVSLVIECMIRGIEARTMDTGVTLFVIPADAARADVPRLQHQRDVSLQQAEAVRQAAVTKSMREGFVLTQYFYNELGTLEHNPEGLKEAVGPMVFGMDVDVEVHRAKQISFVEQAPGDVIRMPVSDRGLDHAEAQLKAGDAEAASKLAMQAIKDHTADPARADYLLALTWLLKGDMDSAANDFRETIRLSQDPHLLAWSHIYLGRIADVRDQRPDALAEYKTAMTVRDGQQDTLQAAQKGIAQPYALPHTATPDGDSPSKPE